MALALSLPKAKQAHAINNITNVEVIRLVFISSYFIGR
jgi:hypothetical protein